MHAASAQPKNRRLAGLGISALVRIIFVVLMVAFQLVTCWLVVRFLQNYAITVYALLELLSAVVTVVLISGHKDPSYRYAWIVVVLILGVFGLVLYLFWGWGGSHNALSRRIKAGTEHPILEQPEALACAQGALQALEQQEPQSARIARYLTGMGFPLYQGTDAQYYPLGEQAFDAILADIERAQIFIFLEFFIVFEGALWERIFSALMRKVQQGVKVRLMYDDFGSLPTTTRAFLKRVRDAGIEVQVFNPVQHYIHQLYLNYRDHRKIVSIDGQVAYTGGVNIGDEYANLYDKHGHWKDTAVRLEGPGAHSLTEFFVRMWAAVTDQPIDIRWPFPAPRTGEGAQGIVIPYEDGPHNNPQNPAEAVYRDMIYAARQSVRITTPYLVIDDLMLEAMCQAARSGVDVRIVLPSRPDHWYVHLTSQSFYGELMSAGVRVYEYTPGFMHAKMVAVDGAQAVVGSINMDYRSFNLQYESAVFFCGGALPATVYADMDAAIAASHEVAHDEWKQRKWYVKTIQPVLRLFGPLM